MGRSAGLPMKGLVVVAFCYVFLLRVVFGFILTTTVQNLLGEKCHDQILCQMKVLSKP